MGGYPGRWWQRLSTAGVLFGFVVVLAWALSADGKPLDALLPGVVAGVLGAFAPSMVRVVRGRRAGLRSAGAEVSAFTVHELPESVAWLLHPAREAVAFFGRLAVREQLAAWCADEGVPMVRLVVAAAGVGKTRLARQVAADARGRVAGWDCWWVAPGREDDAAAAMATEGAPRRLLVVVDYADSREPAGLAALIASAARRSRARVLLLARAAGPWWESLSASYPQQASLIDAITVSANVIELSPEADDRSPSEIVSSAMSQFSQRLGKPVPSLETTRSYEPGTPLLWLHAEALLAVLGRTPTDQGRQDVIGEVLGHEARYWRHSAHRADLALPDHPAEAARWMRRVVGVAALLGAVDERQVAGVVTRALGHEVALSEVLRWVTWLKSLYPAGDGYDDEAAVRLGTLQPDLLAEHLAARVLSDSTVAEMLDVFSGLAPEQAVQALTVLGRAHVDHPTASKVIGLALQSDFIIMATAAVRVGPRFPGVFAPQLTSLLATTTMDRTQLRSLVEGIPYPSLELHPVALTAATVVLNRDTDLSTPDRAWWQRCRALRLAEAGLSAEALAASEEAVGLYRNLARDDQKTFLPDLARSVANHAVWLAEAARPAEALASSGEAVKLYQMLARDNRDTYLPDLARSMNNHALQLAEAAQPARAMRMSKTVVDMYRTLAAADRVAYLPGLAASVNNHAGRLAEASRPMAALDASEEAVSLYRELVSTNRDAHLPGLAVSVNNLARSLANVGLSERALTTSEEAIALYRELAAANPSTYLPGMKKSVTHHVHRLVGRLAEATAAYQEAVNLHEDLTITDSRSRHREEAESSYDAEYGILHITAMHGAGDIP